MFNYDIKMPYYLQAKRYKTMLSNFLNIDITRSKNKGLKAVFLIWISLIMNSIDNYSVKNTQKNE